MQFSSLVLAAAAFVGSNAALILTAPTYAGITVGTPFNISYSGASAEVTLYLENGPSTNLKNFETIKSGLPFPSGSYTWTPESSLPADTYAIKITDGVTTNYGALFQLLGATASASSSVSSAISSASSSASSASTSSAATSTSSGASSTSASTISSSSGNSTAKTTSASKTTASAGSKTTSAAASGTTTSAPGGNSASGLASPLAMVLLAFAAVLSLN